MLFFFSHIVRIKEPHAKEPAKEKYNAYAIFDNRPFHCAPKPVNYDSHIVTFILILYNIIHLYFFVKKEMAKEESPLEAIFRNLAYVKIVDTLVSHSDCEYTLIELAESADVQPSWVSMQKDVLLHYNIMKPTSIVNTEQRYQFNKKSPVGMLLNDLSFKLADIDIGLEL